MLMQGFSTVLSLIYVAILLLAVFAFADAAMRRKDAYPAADKQTKPFWLIILGLTVLVNLLSVLLFLNFLFLIVIGLIATIVYLVDVRPALRQVSGGSGRRRGSSSDGPYGPYNGGR